MIEIVRRHIREGIRPVPIPYREKKPIIDNWPALVITEENVGQFFNGSQMNVGAILGEPSGGLQDIDLDCPEAFDFARLWLPPTRTFGRRSNPTSHYLYRAPDLAGEGIKTFDDPLAKLTGRKGKLVELRSNGGQTVFPGSTHKDTGELIEWDNPNVPFTECSRATLERITAEIAAGCCILRYWNPAVAGPLFGALRAAGWERDQIERFLKPFGEIIEWPVSDPLAWIGMLATPRLTERAEEKEARTWKQAHSAFHEKMRSWLGLPAPPKATRAAKTNANGGASKTIRARAYVAEMPAAISGSGGHTATYAVARKLVQDFELSEDDAWTILLEYNTRCEPPWSEKELRHKLLDAFKARVANPVEDRSLGSIPPPPPGSSDEPPPETPPIQLTFDNGSPAKSPGNVVKLLLEHTAWRGGPRIDKFGLHVRWPIPLPEPVAKALRTGAECLVEDAVYVQEWLLKQPFNLKVRAGLDMVKAAIYAAARCNHFDSLRDRIESFPAWDGCARLSNWLHTYMGAEDNDVNKRIGRAWFIACIARAFEPGCVADAMLVLEGLEAVGKNRAIEVLFGGYPWVGSLGSYKIGRDREADRIAGECWVLHIDELSGLSHGSVEEVKSWLSRKIDPYRIPYDRSLVYVPRRCVAIGSTNKKQYLQDDQNRRFWPVECGRGRARAFVIDFRAIERDREQLFAEAIQAYRAGEPWVIGRGDGVWEELTEAQNKRKLSSELVDEVADVLAQLPAGTDCTVQWITDRMGMSPKDRMLDGRLDRKVCDVLHHLGWEREIYKPTSGKTKRRWRKLPDPVPVTPVTPPSTEE